MIDPQAVRDEFCELVQIDSLSGEEGRIAEVVSGKLGRMGLSVVRDRAGEAIGGQCGNVIGKLPATDRSLPTIMLNAHLDTVRPGSGVKPVSEGDIIRSSGETILGADDKAGLAIILAGLREIGARQVPHGELQVVFTIAEEIGLHGARHLDYSLLSPRYCFVFDGGDEIGELTVAAPSAKKMTWKVHGVAAHAGVHPEKGINAIQVAAQAIARMKLGRLDEESTANIGYISGGIARNIVPELCQVWGEARSHDEGKLAAQVEHMRTCLTAAVAAYPEARLEEEVQSSYQRFHLSEEEEVVRVAASAARNLGLPVSCNIGGGGSDANVFNERGLPALICACGGANAHTMEEQVSLSAMAKGVEWVVEMVKVSG